MIIHTIFWLFLKYARCWHKNYTYILFIFSHHPNIYYDHFTDGFVALPLWPSVSFCTKEVTGRAGRCPAGLFNTRVLLTLLLFNSLAQICNILFLLVSFPGEFLVISIIAACLLLFDRTQFILQHGWLMLWWFISKTGSVVRGIECSKERALFAAERRWALVFWV